MPYFAFDKESGTATCILYDNDKTYCGAALCHPDDRDMMSKRTGLEIAYRRAEIQALRGFRDEIKIELRALKQLYYSINRSKYYNSKNYEARMLNRHIAMTESDLEVVKETIKNKNKELRDYITDKDNFYKKVRHNRETDVKLKDSLEQFTQDEIQE